MQITITARDILLNDAAKEIIRIHLTRIENRFPTLSQAEIVLTQLPRNQFHANLRVDGAKHHYHAAATDYDLLRAVDIAIRHIRAQANKNHKKIREHFKHRLSPKEVIGRLEDQTQ
jgi:ribosomal subunit interface protein